MYICINKVQRRRRSVDLSKNLRKNIYLKEIGKFNRSQLSIENTYFFVLYESRNASRLKQQTFSKVNITFFLNIIVNAYFKTLLVVSVCYLVFY